MPRWAFSQRMVLTDYIWRGGPLPRPTPGDWTTPHGGEWNRHPSPSACARLQRRGLPLLVATLRARIWLYPIRWTTWSDHHSRWSTARAVP